MDLGLDDRRVLVTGSTRGIGFAAARAFARERAVVLVHGRQPQAAAVAAERIRAEVPGARVEGVAGDLATAEGAAAVLAAAAELDVLVNNAGVFEAVPFEDITDAEWTRLWETNVMSGVRLARHHLPRMLRRGWGRIVFVSSESALQIPVEMVHYGTTKTAQLAVSRGLAERTRGTGVTVNAVLPGPTRSEGVDTWLAGLAAAQGTDVAAVEREFFRAMRPSSLLQRFATPDEVATMIVYVASAAASAVNGAALRVDGGVVRAIP